MARAPEAERIRGARYFHVMGCSLMANESFRQEVFAAVERFAGVGARITFDPNIRFELLAERSVEDIAGPVLRRCAVLFPGEKEAQLLGGSGETEAAVQALFRRYPLEVLVLKRGRRGCTVYSAGLRQEVPAFRVREVDPTGSGDCFDAGFLCGLLEGRPLEECARLAAAVGALNAQAFGPMEGKISPQAANRLLKRRPK
jgi:sugar/nucleoside kinase (ribokinase family)